MPGFVRVILMYHRYTCLVYDDVSLKNKVITERIFARFNLHMKNCFTGNLLHFCYKEYPVNAV
jgi:hypothetical protein